MLSGPRVAGRRYNEMMKRRVGRVIIAHGWNDGGANAWIAWLAEELRRSGYEVVTPVFPHVHVPRPTEWVAALREAAGRLDEHTVLVGYSLGVPTVLRYLNDYPEDVTIAGLVLVAGFGDGLGGRPAGLFDPPLDYDRLKRRARERVCIYADNDYLISPKRTQKLALDLEAREVIVMGGGHLVGLPLVPGSVSQIPAVKRAVLRALRRRRVTRGWQRIWRFVRRWTHALPWIGKEGS